MFRFMALELVHWDYWERVMLPLDESIITIVGPNGSGKTTLLDAMRTVLALNTSRKRSYPTYVQHSNRPYAWIRAVVTNQRDHRGRRPFFPLTTDQVTLACRVIRRSGEWQRQYRIESGDVAVQELSTQEERFLGVQEYRHRLTAGGLSQAVLRVLSLEQGATDKLCELSPRELLDLVYDVTNAGCVAPAGDKNGVPYTALVYGNGPGYRGATRVDPRVDPFPGRSGAVPNGPAHPAYFQEAAVPLDSAGGWLGSIHIF